MLRTFPAIRQRDTMDCGPTCLAMIAQAQGAYFRLDDLREWAGINRQGVSLHGLTLAAERMGFTTLPVKIDFATLRAQAPLPAIPRLTG